jgi:filamentous hemagglutinin family protein
MKTKFYLSLLTLIGLAANTQAAPAQTYQPSNRIPVADKTLGTQVSATGNNFSITGGVNKGQTLFQSFTDFSVPTNGQVNFLNPVGNRDIITRVTGNLFSDINGTVNTNGANFFLINPHGIIFGTNAWLNVGKAFVGSTANGIDLLDSAGKTFNFGVNGTGDTALLSVNSNVLFNPNRLILGSNLSGSRGIENYGTLQTPNDSQYIGLIGGKVTIDGGFINAPGGRIDLGGLNTPGTIAIDKQGLVFAGNNLIRSDVSLLNGAQVNVTADRVLGNVNTFSSDVANLGSRINIHANNLNISNDRSTSNQNSSNLNAGLGQNAAIKITATGGINIDATGQVTLNNGGIYNTIDTGATGQLGDIQIGANAINIGDGSNILARVIGAGSAGNINIKTTQDLTLSGTNDPKLLQGNLTGDLSLISTSSLGQGDAGKISIDTRNLLVTNRGGISSYIAGAGVGNSQGVRIGANNVSVANLSNIASSVFGGTGNAGNIEIATTGNLDISGTNDRSLLQPNLGSLSSISSVNSGRGDAGKISINANTIAIANRGGIFSSIEPAGNGNSQGIGIATGNLNISNFSTIFADNNGKGNAGNIDIKTTRDLNLSGTDDRSIIKGNETSPFSSISSVIKGQGNTGKITIATQGNLAVDNVGGIFSSVVDVGTGNSQGVSISAKNISLTNLSDLGTSVYGGTGNAGNIDIKTTGNLTISGTENLVFLKSDQFFIPLTQISSFTNGRGNAGKISIDTQGSLAIANRGGIFATILGTGVGDSQGISINAGNISLTNISAIESASYAGGIGNSGNIDINSKGAIDLSNNSRISSSSQGRGAAANITIASPQFKLNNSAIFAENASATGGNIQLNLNDRLLIRNASKISTTSGSIGKNGNGGNITIDSPLIIATPGNNDITANAYAGNGGKVNITSQGLFGIQNRLTGNDLTNDITASSTFGQSGTVNITTPGTDPGKDSTELPNVTTDASNQISQVCSAGNRQNKLTVTGRGGLPANASDALTNDVVWQDARALSSQPAVAMTTPAPLVPPAVGWVFDGSGKVTLIAAGTPGQPAGTSVVCPPVAKH